MSGQPAWAELWQSGNYCGGRRLVGRYGGGFATDTRKKNSHIRVVHQPGNLGVAEARNAGVAAAAGDYIGFVDGDGPGGAFHVRGDAKSL